MAEKTFPPPPPPQTRMIDESGAPTRELYEYLLKLTQTLEQENADLKRRLELILIKIDLH